MLYDKIYQQANLFCFQNTKTNTLEDFTQYVPKMDGYSNILKAAF